MLRKGARASAYACGSAGVCLGGGERGGGEREIERGTFRSLAHGGERAGERESPLYCSGGVNTLATFADLFSFVFLYSFAYVIKTLVVLGEGLRTQDHRK